jgi:hypothetical protein
MLYNAPYGQSDPNASYINGNPAAGIQGSIPPAASIEYPQRELVNFFTDCGLAPTNADLHQLSEAVQTGRVVYSADTGSANVLSIALTPPLVAYVDGMIFRVRVNTTNTGAATFNAGPSVLNIVRRGGGPLQAGDLPGGYISILCYSALHNNVELYGVNFSATSGGLPPIMSANMNLYVDTGIGSDTLYDGTSATVSGPHGPFKTIMKAVYTTFTYGPSVYTMTINIAAGTYPEAVAIPDFPGPSTILKGAGINQTIVSGAPNQSTIACVGANTLQVQNLTSTASKGGTGPPCCFLTGTGSRITTSNCASGSANASIFEAYGGEIIIGNHTFNSGSTAAYGIYAVFGGFIVLTNSASYTFSGPLSVSAAFLAAGFNGSVGIGQPGFTPVWINKGYVSGRAWLSVMNGIIDTESNGVGWIPGNQSSSYTQYGGQAV